MEWKEKIFFAALTPRHLWSNESKFKRSWILFNSDDHFGCPKSTESLESSDAEEYFEKTASNRFANLNFGDLNFNDIQFHFRAYLQTRGENNSLISMKSCFCDSPQSILSDELKTSLNLNQLECERCKNLILRRENRRCSMCCDCVEKLYSPKTCTACNGRISFQDLKDSSIQQSMNKKHFVEHFDSQNVKLCNCFPKYPSQNFSSIQPSDPNEIQVLPQITGKSSSCNELTMVHQTKKKFYSNNCLPLKSTSDEESLSDAE